KRIGTAADTVMPLQQVLENEKQIEFQVPGQWLSYRTLIRFTRALLNIENNELSIDVTEDNNSYVAQIRVSGGPYGYSLGTAISPISDTVEALITKIGKAAMRVVQPYVLAIYEMRRVAVACNADFLTPPTPAVRRVISGMSVIVDPFTLKGATLNHSLCDF